jgi:hypothetical protein
MLSVAGAASLRGPLAGILSNLNLMCYQRAYYCIYRHERAEQAHQQQYATAENAELCSEVAMSITEYTVGMLESAAAR